MSGAHQERKTRFNVKRGFVQEKAVFRLKCLCCEGSGGGRTLQGFSLYYKWERGVCPSPHFHSGILIKLFLKNKPLNFGTSQTQPYPALLLGYSWPKWFFWFFVFF